MRLYSFMLQKHLYTRIKVGPILIKLQKNGKGAAWFQHYLKKNQKLLPSLLIILLFNTTDVGAEEHAKPSVKPM